MTEAQFRQLLEEAAKALTAVGILPWWAYLLIILVALPILFAWFHVAQVWPPGWDTPSQSPPIPVQPDGTIHLQQEPPKEYL